ncbi:MAG: SpoIID/LytB domain-containing protein [Bdellovibrionales bacterium]
MRIFVVLLVSAWMGGASAQDQIIRIRVAKNLSTLSLKGVSIRVLGSGGDVLSTEGLTKMKIRRSTGGWLLKKEGADDLLVNESQLTVRAAFLEVKGRRLTDELHLVATDENRYDLVVHMPIERYLMGVVPSEMPLYWHEEALKAQTVAARSYALRTAKARKSWHFDVETSIRDQVFKFNVEEDLPKAIRTKLKRVVTQTKGEVLRDEQSRVVRAYYSADCGCKSEDPKFVWGVDENMESVEDPTCRLRPQKKWNLAIDRQELRSSLFRTLGLNDRDELSTIQIAEKSPSGRVSRLVALVKVKGESVLRYFSAQDFRRLVGFRKVLSTDFQIQWIADQLHITGYGQGHGVGLCQTGARFMARHGSSYREILRNFYPKATIAQ